MGGLPRRRPLPNRTMAPCDKLVSASIPYTDISSNRAIEFIASVPVAGVRLPAVLEGAAVHRLWRRQGRLRRPQQLPRLLAKVSWKETQLERVVLCSSVVLSEFWRNDERNNTECVCMLSTHSVVALPPKFVMLAAQQCPRILTKQRNDSREPVVVPLFYQIPRGFS